LKFGLKLFIVFPFKCGRLFMVLAHAAASMTLG